MQLLLKLASQQDHVFNLPVQTIAINLFRSGILKYPTPGAPLGVENPKNLCNRNWSIWNLKQCRSDWNEELLSMDGQLILRSVSSFGSWGEREIWEICDRFKNSVEAIGTESFFRWLITDTDTAPTQLLLQIQRKERERRRERETVIELPRT